MLWSYIEKRLRRNVGQMLLLGVMIAAVIALLLVLYQYQDGLEARLDQVYDEFEIRCTATTAGGAQVTNLKIKAETLALFEAPKGKLKPYIKDLFLLREIWNSTVGETPIKLYATTDPVAAPHLEGIYVNFDEGHVPADLGGEEALCIVSEPLLKRMDGQGNITVLLEKYGEVTFHVIGHYESEEDAVFAAWYPLNAVFEDRGINTVAHSMAFTVADNRRLDELKQRLSEFFAPASTVYQGGTKAGLIIDDALFRDQVTVLERGIILLRIVRLLILALSIGISFLVAYLNIRGRQLELAVMRSMGTRRVALYAEVLCEHILLCLPGVLIAVGGVTLFGAVPDAAQWRLIGQFMLCYLFGVAISVSQVTSGKIMQILKGKE
ncbi:MAG: hypothetical protein IJW99_05835 [Clostridia bacterium]|nr:hypothetical protein [Clostridia bacterium]